MPLKIGFSGQVATARLLCRGLVCELKARGAKIVPWLLTTLFLIASCSLFIISNVAFAGQTSHPARQINWHAMGSTPCAWSPPVVDAHDVIDPEATIRVLKANGLDCYGALIWRELEGGSKSFDWPDFKEFVAAAGSHGVNVWAILIPPAEGGDSPPFNQDYVRWMRELAKLSLRFPNLRGVNIDDYLAGEANRKLFTPSYTCSLYRAKQAINPKLQFVPTFYDLDRSLAEQYGSCIDGVWLWNTNLDNRYKLNFKSWLENTRLAVGGRFPIYGGVYAHASSWHSEPPKPAWMGNSLETACQYADGAILWQLPLTPPDNPWLKVARTFGTGGSSSLAGRCGTLVQETGR